MGICATRWGRPFYPSYLNRSLVTTVLISSISILLPSSPSARAQANPTPYCQQLPAAIQQKEALRAAAMQGNVKAQQEYGVLVAQHAAWLRRCRQQVWPQTQALWIRLYPCDARPWALDGVLDRIVNRGYNQINVEVFYNGRVLLPANQNPTAWRSVMAGSGADNVDLLAQVIRKGRERGLAVHAWLFSMNVGADYARRLDKQDAVAQNGLGQTSLTANIVPGMSVELGAVNPDEAFIDPYSVQVRRDYSQLVQAIAQYRPDGLLFDYIRYPRGYGVASVAGRVQDLWIYGESSHQTLLQRAFNYKGMELIQRFMNQGYLKPDDLQTASQLYPQDGDPNWQGLNPVKVNSKLPLAKQLALLQEELWQLVVAHASQGVLDYLATAIAALPYPMPAGAVFFPEGNLSVGKQGFDSRLQMWNRFPATLSWNPMAYGVCGKTDCIVSQILRVVRQSPPGTQVIPAIAGVWQQSVGNRPPLEQQMAAIYQAVPSIKGVSHFAYSWQEPGSDQERKYCRLR